MAEAFFGTGGSVAVRLHSCGGFIRVIELAVGLFLEEFGEVGDLFGDGVGTARVLGRDFGELMYGVGTGTFDKYGLDACGIMVVVVEVLASNGMDVGTKFASVVFAGRELMLANRMMASWVLSTVMS